jgi:hypothetical protein
MRGIFDFSAENAKNRGLLGGWWSGGHFLTQKLSVPKGLRSRFPTPTEQGIILTEQGIQFAEQGTYKVAQGIREGDSDPKQKSVHSLGASRSAQRLEPPKTGSQSAPLQRKLRPRRQRDPYARFRLNSPLQSRPEQLISTRQELCEVSTATELLPRELSHFKKQLTLKFSRSLKNATC